MSRRINHFSNGGFIEFDEGSFDSWCVYVTRSNGQRFAPTDVQYFSRLRILGEIYGPRNIYDDFVVVFNRTGLEIQPGTLKLIHMLSHNYGNDALEMEIWFNVLYAGMIAEENKENAILGKRIKRLGMHQVLIENLAPGEASTFSKGKKWKELHRLMKKRGF